MRNNTVDCALCQQLTVSVSRPADQHLHFATCEGPEITTALGTRAVRLRHGQLREVVLSLDAPAEGLQGRSRLRLGPGSAHNNRKTIDIMMRKHIIVIIATATQGVRQISQAQLLRQASKYKHRNYSNPKTRHSYPNDVKY